jgi:hypothetical protein
MEPTSRRSPAALSKPVSPAVAREISLDHREILWASGQCWHYGRRWLTGKQKGLTGAKKRKGILAAYQCIRLRIDMTFNLPGREAQLGRGADYFDR